MNYSWVICLVVLAAVIVFSVWCIYPSNYTVNTTEKPKDDIPIEPFTVYDTESTYQQF